MRRLALLIVVSLVMAASPASADDGEMNRYAKQHYDQALEYFAAGKYREASDAFYRAYKEDKRVEILFGWAQSKRLFGDCKGAVKLYRKLLRKNLPAADRKEVVKGMEACKADPKDDEVSSKDESDEEEVQEEDEEDETEEAAEPPEEKPAAAAKTEEPEDSGIQESVAAASTGSPWYTDIIGDALLVSGVVGLGIGTGYFMVSSSDRSAADEATNYEAYTTLADRASDRRIVAIVVTSASGAMVVGAIVRYVMRDRGAEKAPAVSLWGDSNGGGFAIGGRF